MNEVERLIARDKASGSIPEPPDVRYTVAAVQRRLGRRPPEAAPRPEWAPIFAAGAVGVAVAFAAVALGLSPWWLLMMPISSFGMIPLLLGKGVKR